MNSPTPEASRAALDEVDLLELFKELKNHTKSITLCALAGLSLTGIYGFFIAKPEYISSALLLPTESSNNDQMNTAAALLGKKPNSSDVELYQSLLTSRTVIQNLIRSSIANESDTARGRLEPVYRILSIDTANKDVIENSISSLSKAIEVDSKENGDGGIIEIKFKANAPWLAKNIGNAVLTIGHKELYRVRTERANATLSSLSNAVKQSKIEWDTTSRSLSVYKDRNRSISLPEQYFEISQLEMEKTAKEQKYLLARREYETLLLEQAKAAAPMIILDSASMPCKKSKPNRRNLLLAGLFSGFFISSIYFSLKYIFKTR